MGFNKLQLAKDLHERYATVLARQHGELGEFMDVPPLETRRPAAQCFWRSIAAAMIEHSSTQTISRGLFKSAEKVLE